MIKVLIADDHQLMIDGIKMALAGIDEIGIVAEVHDGSQVLEKLGSGMPVDIILMDINMPKMDGLACTRFVRKKYPDIRIIALSQYDEKRLVKQMIRNGVSGYLLKDTGREILEKAIRTVSDGGKYFSDRLSVNLINRELKMEETKSLFPELTDRECEILRFLGKEYSSQQISEKLFISMRTVEHHRARLMFKAGVKNTAGLIRWATENDYLD